MSAESHGECYCRDKLAYKNKIKNSATNDAKILGFGQSKFMQKCSFRVVTTTGSQMYCASIRSQNCEIVRVATPDCYDFASPLPPHRSELAIGKGGEAASVRVGRIM